MPGGLTLLAGTNASIPTPATGKVTIYFSTDLNQPAYKDDTGTVHSLIGSVGATGSQGFEGPEGNEPDTMLALPGPQGNPGVTGPQGPMGLPYIPEDVLFDDVILPDPSSPSIPARIRQVGITVDGGGSAITTGVKGYRTIPWSGTITGVRMLADQSGSCVIDIWKDTYANYPPTVADTITAAAKPTISATNKSEDTTLTGWTKSVTAGDVLGFNVDSATTITRVTLELTIVLP